MEDEEEQYLKNRIIYKDLMIKRIFKKYMQLVNLLNSPTSILSSPPTTTTTTTTTTSNLSQSSNADISMSDSSQTSHSISNLDMNSQIQLVYKQLLNEFSLFELSIQKAQSISQTCSEESNYYIDLCKQREIEIENEKKEIVKLKEQLDHEKKHRQYKEQYLALYKAINEKPSIEQTEKEIQKSQKELNELSDQANRTTSKLELRTKQFQLLLHTLGELEKNLDDDFMVDQINSSNSNNNNNNNENMNTNNSNNNNNEENSNNNEENNEDEVMKENEDDEDDEKEDK